MNPRNKYPAFARLARQCSGGLTTGDDLTMSKLTTEQHVVLAFFDAHGAAAMRLARQRWVWADDIRNDPASGRSASSKIDAEEYRGGEMLRAWLAPIGKAVRQ